MASSTAAARTARSQESTEVRFKRLLKESREINPQASGSREHLTKDTLSTLKAWSKLRRRANRIT